MTYRQKKRATLTSIIIGVFGLYILITPTATAMDLDLSDFIEPLLKPIKRLPPPSPELNDITIDYGTVYIAYTIDTESRVIDTSVYEQTLGLQDYEPGATVDQLLQPTFRNQYHDSFGDPVVFSWFLLTQQIQCASTAHDCSLIHAAMQRYKERAYSLGDMYGWHYHHMDWTDINHDGIHFWNQLKTFNGTVYGNGSDVQTAERMIAQLILDKGVYPGAFRTGWTWQNNQLSVWLDDITPFDFSNISPQKTDTGDPPPPPGSAAVIEPTYNIFDWSRASQEWTFYHPWSADYQRFGNLKRYEFRSYNSDLEWEKAFQAAQQGYDQLVVTYSHSYNQLSLYESYLDKIEALGEKYPNVKFKFVTAEEGARRMISNKNYDGISPTVVATQSQNLVTVNVDEPLFTFPYGALFINGDYQRIFPTQTNPVMTDDGHQEWTFDLSSFTEGQFRIGGIDPSGNWFVTPTFYL